MVVSRLAIQNSRPAVGVRFPGRKNTNLLFSSHTLIFFISNWDQVSALRVAYIFKAFGAQELLNGYLRV